jgi:hypothetical protein
MHYGEAISQRRRPLAGRVRSVAKKAVWDWGLVTISQYVEFECFLVFEIDNRDRRRNALAKAAPDRLVFRANTDLLCSVACLTECYAPGQAFFGALGALFCSGCVVLYAAKKQLASRSPLKTRHKTAQSIKELDGCWMWDLFW